MLINSTQILLVFIILGDSSIIIDKHNDDFSLKIEEIHLNAPPKSVSSPQPDTIYYQNYSLESLISNLTDTPLNLIKTNHKGYMQTKVNVSYKNYTKNNQNDTLLAYLAKGFGFTITDTILKKDINQIKIQDYAKLKKHQSDSTAMRIRSGEKELKLYKVGLNNMAAMLSSITKELTLPDTGTISGDYDFILPKNKTALKEQLKNEYGLELIEKENERIDFLYIEFE